MTGQGFQWGKKEQMAFDYLKHQFITAPILAMPDKEKPFILETDTSQYALGAVLKQEDEHGRERPVSYLFQLLNPVQWNYQIYDKELLAVMLALEHWRHFLKGAPEFQIWTDHKNLQYFREPQKLNRRQARWFTELAEYNFMLHHRPGQLNKIADYLSQGD